MNTDDGVLTIHCTHPIKTYHVVCVRLVSICPFHDLFSSSAKSARSEIRQMPRGQLRAVLWKWEDAEDVWQQPLVYHWPFLCLSEVFMCEFHLTDGRADRSSVHWFLSKCTRKLSLGEADSSSQTSSEVWVPEPASAGAWGRCKLGAGSEHGARSPSQALRYEVQLSWVTSLTVWHSPLLFFSKQSFMPGLLF